MEESGRVTVILASYQVPSSALSRGPADDVMDDCRPWNSCGWAAVRTKSGYLCFLPGTYEKTLMTS